MSIFQYIGNHRRQCHQRYHRGSAVVTVSTSLEPLNGRYTQTSDVSAWTFAWPWRYDFGILTVAPTPWGTGITCPPLLQMTGHGGGHRE